MITLLFEYRQPPEAEAAGASAFASRIAYRRHRFRSIQQTSQSL